MLRWTLGALGWSSPPLMSEATPIRDNTTTPSIAIVEAVAEREGTHPSELTPRLYTVVDPEALNSLFQPPGEEDTQHTMSVRFTYCGYEVCVDSEDGVTVDE